MNSNKPFEKQIKSFNFMLVRSEKNSISPCLPFTKDIRGIQYKPFTDYKTDTVSDNLPLLSWEYWHTLEGVLTQYVRHNDKKFDYNNEGIANRKRIIADRIRYIGKESNNLDDNINGLEDVNYLEYVKDHEIVNSKEFLDWVLTLKPKNVMDKEILKMALWKVKNKMKHDKQINPKIKSV
ncbi:MAG: hypothetical protein ACP5IB_08275 [Thermoplasmata archaeon]